MRFIEYTRFASIKSLKAIEMRVNER